MRNELQTVITNFRHNQELALEYLHGRLGIPVPSTKYEWAANGRNQIESVMPTVVSDGVQIRKHGVGVEVIHPKFRIDFEYGPAGECDCFDGWRLGLHKHISIALPDPVECDREIRQWLDEAAESGDLLPVPDTYSFFVWPESRSRWSTSKPNVG